MLRKVFSDGVVHLSSAVDFPLVTSLLTSSAMHIFRIRMRGMQRVAAPHVSVPSCSLNSSRHLTAALGLIQAPSSTSPLPL
mmetsp:Transcript_109045/g.184930  ORF Transcript_109045/g.184930 Transcript_109045/m.184930 type:complete len:81 (+) Transcript_109045:1600-1842(+)